MLACSCDSVIICKNYQSFFSFQGGFLTRKLYRRYSLETSRLVRSPTASRSPLFEGGHAFSDRVTCPRYVLSISFICAMCRTLRLYLFSLASFMPGSCSTTPQSASQTAPQAWGALNVSTCTGFSRTPAYIPHTYSRPSGRYLPDSPDSPDTPDTPDSPDSKVNQSYIFLFDYMSGINSSHAKSLPVLMAREVLPADC